MKGSSLLPVVLLAVAGFVAYRFFYPSMPSSEPATGGTGGGAPGSSPATGGSGGNAGGASTTGSGTSSAPPPSFAAQLTAKAGTFGLSNTLNADEWNWVTQQLTGGTLPAPEAFLPTGMDRYAKMSAADYVRYITGAGVAPAGMQGVY